MEFQAGTATRMKLQHSRVHLPVCHVLRRLLVPAAELNRSLSQGCTYMHVATLIRQHLPEHCCKSLRCHAAQSILLTTEPITSACLFSGFAEAPFLMLTLAP